MEVQALTHYKIIYSGARKGSDKPRIGRSLLNKTENPQVRERIFKTVGRPILKFGRSRRPVGDSGALATIRMLEQSQYSAVTLL
jgi:hypothetical protein